MKRILTIVVVCLFAGSLLLLAESRATARDYMVDVVSENYREQAVDDGNSRRVFHTIQVNSDLGSRLLILEGDDFQYRSWLRAWLSRTNRLLVRVPEADDDAFRMSKAQAIDVTQIYPIDGKQWQSPGINAEPGPAFTGKRHVLIVDANEKRRELIDLIVRDLGFPVTICSNDTDALLMFRMQPDKFCMVITTLPGISGAQLVRNILHRVPALPVIIGTPYGDTTKEKNAAARFAGADSVVVKPVVLRELPKTILTLLKERA